VRRDTSSLNDTPSLRYMTRNITDASAQRPSAAAHVRNFRRSIIEDAPDDLDEVEAAIDREPKPQWLGLVRLALLAYTVGFWVALAWLLL
jgi:hypothetical protein